MIKTFDSALRAAFEAGYAAADNGRDPDFDGWRARLSGLEADPIKVGDFVEHGGSTWRVLDVDGDELLLHDHHLRARRTHINYVKRMVPA